MEITFRIEILILIFVVFFILAGHLFCSCARTTPFEAMTTMATMASTLGPKLASSLGPNATILNGGGNLTNGVTNTNGKKMGGPQAATLSEGFSGINNKGRGNLQLFATTEGFTGANTNNGESSLFNAPSPDTKSWFTPNLTYQKGKKVDKGVQNILNRPTQPVPLPNGEMLMFKNTEFSPSCCPNTYSNSSGCACMTVGQYNYLIDRGGNNVPYSEY